jgi:hypothetical protein
MKAESVVRSVRQVSLNAAVPQNARPFPIHVILNAIFPVVFMYSRYVMDVPPFALQRVLIVSLALGVGGTIVLSLIFRDWLRGAMLMSLGILGSYILGHGYALLLARGVLGANQSLVEVFILIIWVAVLAVSLILSAKYPTTMRRVTVGLNVFAAVLLLIPTLNSVRWMVFKPVVENFPHFATGTKANPRSKPDIYYIILDGFARQDVLKRYYNEDNAWFLDSLQSLGFRINPESRANYGQTLMSLASSLNTSYLEELVPQSERVAEDRRVLPELIQHNAVFDYLKTQGYRIVCIASGYSGTEVRGCDEYLAPTISVNDVENDYLEASLVRIVLDLVSPGWQGKFQRGRILFALNSLPIALHSTSPKMVFAHIVAPHPPFVFGPEGEIEDDVVPLLFDDGTSYVERAGKQEYINRYRRQIRFVEHAILKTLRTLLSMSTSEPLIILQSDHGSGLTADWSHPSNTDLSERLPILNAFYVPTGDTGLQPTKTPVNTFRRLFNHYFAAGMPELPDSSYFSGWWAPFDYVRWRVH